MKPEKRIALCTLSLLLLLTACGGRENAVQSAASSAAAGPLTPAISQPTAEIVPAPELPASKDGIDIDLTQLSATMVYAQVFNMLCDPQRYVGKTVRMQGQSYSEYYEITEKNYYSVIIQDATACCFQGLEYELAAGEYPPDDLDVTVTGVFDTYDELGETFLRLRDAQIES